MESRRSFIAGLLATGMLPKPTWANAGSPAYLSAGMKPDGRYVLCGLASDGRVTFELLLPARGHAAAAHPTAPDAVAFARRPGMYAVVLDCSNGSATTQLTAPPGRHFYGHGAFSSDGELLFTTENDYENARGVVGVWRVRNNYERIGEFWSGGTGPHDIKLLPNSRTLVVANGGIETHPETGRTKLNLPTMESNLCYLTFDGKLEATMALGPEHQRNSIRHLAVSDAGDVAFATQWQGDIAADLPLLGIHRIGSGQLELFEDASVRALRGYVGSVSINDRSKEIAVTSPRMGAVHVFAKDRPNRRTALSDVCGVAATGGGFLFTTGRGVVQSSAFERTYDLAWDNHLIAL